MNLPANAVAIPSVPPEGEPSESDRPAIPSDSAVIALLQNVTRIGLDHQPHFRAGFQVKRLASAGGEMHLKFSPAIYFRDHSDVTLLH